MKLKAKEGVIYLYFSRKSTGIVDLKLQLKGYINEILFSLKSRSRNGGQKSMFVLNNSILEFGEEISNKLLT